MRRTNARQAMYLAGACGISLLSCSLSARAADAGTAFNPKISLVLQGTYANYGNDGPVHIPGYILSSDTEFRPAGLSLRETELALEANVDDYFHGFANISLSNNNDGSTTVSVEEAAINTTSLPYGLVAKIGRFYSDIGYQNHVHTHAWDFVDAPLVYRTMLGDQLADDGGQLKWVAPLDVFLEFGGELTRGGRFPGGGDKRSGVPAKDVFVHYGDDFNDSSSYRLGLSYYRVDADRRSTSDDLGTTQFSGHSGLGIFDFIYKWAPHGNPTVHNAVVQGEVFVRSESGALVFDPGASPIDSDYRGHQHGFYLQGVYQFMPMWRAGVRYDRVGSSNAVSDPAPGTTLAILADHGHPQRYSAMVDWSHSEFSRLRLQYNRDQSRVGGGGDNQVFLQYIFSLGSHPAHTF